MKQHEQAMVFLRRGIVGELSLDREQAHQMIHGPRACVAGRLAGNVNHGK